MNLLNELQKELETIKTNFNESKKQDLKNATKIIKNENKDIYYNISVLYKDNKNNPDELIARIIVTFNLAINKTYEIMTKLIENSTKLIIHLLKKEQILDTDLKELENIYNKTQKELTNLNEKFIKTMYHNYDLYIKNKDNEIVLIINEGKLKLITNLSNILDKNNLIKKIFKYNIIPFIKYIKNSKKEQKIDNKTKITNYFVNIYNDYSIVLLDGYKENTDNYIKTRLDVLNEKIKRYNKKNNTKELNKLKNYLLNFNQELYIRNKDILLEMSNILKADNKLKEKELKKYSRKLDKVYNISYKFDKVFNEYKESCLNILINNKAYDEINKLVKNEEEETEKSFSTSTINLFKDVEGYLNTLIYKILLVEYKTNNYDNLNEILK